MDTTGMDRTGDTMDITERKPTTYEIAELPEDQPASAFENVLAELDLEQGNLENALKILACRLTPVLRKAWPQDEKTYDISKPSKDVDAHAPLVRRISGNVNRERHVIEIVNFIRENLKA